MNFNTSTIRMSALGTGSWFSRVLVVPFTIGLAAAAPLGEQIETFRTARTQDENAVVSLLQAGITEQRSAEAFAAARPWLTANPSTSQALLFHAGKAAEYAGEWQDAVSFYRKLLKLPTLDAAMAGEAVPATYRLLINHLGDPDAAYLFMREDGSRLRAYGRARQFDAWFIAQAKSRKDVSGLCHRLETIIAADPASVTQHDADLAWVCEAFESSAVTDDASLAAAGKLMAMPSLPAPYKARINWVMAIVPFNNEATALFRAKKTIPEKLLEKPLLAAEALVAALPYEGAILVAKGWMNLREGHTPNLVNYLAVRRDAKTAPILKALPGFTQQQIHTFFQTPGCPQGRPISMLFSAAEMRALAVKMPAAFNSLMAPNVPLYEKTLTVEEAKALAPLLVRNPHPDAALVRALAMTGAHTMPTMLPEIMKSEMWRFDSTKSAIDMAWNSGVNRSGVAQPALYKQYPNLGSKYDQLNKQISKQATSQDRLAAFAAIQQELQGNSPTTPGLMHLWNELLKQAPSSDQEKMLEKLVADYNAATPAGLELPRYFLTQALARITFGNPYSRVTFGPEFAGGWDQWGYGNVRKALPKLAAELGKLLKQQMAAGNLSEPILGMWLHCVDPANPEAKALFQELVKTAAYDKVNPSYHKMAAHPLLFGAAAMKLSPTDPRMVSRELLALPKDASPAAVEAALKTVIDRVAKAPTVTQIVGLQAVAASSEWSAAMRQLVFSLFMENAPFGTSVRIPGDELLVQRVLKELQEEKQWSAAEPISAGLWQASSDIAYVQNPDALSLFAEAALAADQPSVAMTLARGGMKSPAGKALAGQPPNPAYAKIIGRLKQVAGKAATEIGAVGIPVDETNPAWPIYKSNSEFVLGNVESAWQLYLTHADQLIPVLRSLSVEYAFWLLQRNIEASRDQDAENLIKELTIWSRQAEGTFSLDQDARLKIAYADLAFRKGALPTARAWYRKVAEAAEYDGSEMDLIASLGSVRVDRVSKNFGAAMTELDLLMKFKNPQFRIPVRYARAEVLMDQESYAEALEEIEQVLRQEPKHADALILRGKIHYEMRKLVEASEIELGPSQDKTIIVPGEAVKINLRDPTLNISGVGADIEVEIWAKSGDRERVLLYQLGDSKEKFRADVPTALGAPIPGDKTLQVLGEDEIRFGYSERFRAKMKDLPADPTVVIGVASDARLAFSAGAFPPREGERRLNIEELGLSTAQAALGTRAVRPGNPVYVRVTDPDQSLTSGVDEVVVSLQTSSGDVIRQLVLKETSPFSGEFQGVVPTAGAQALAFASESAPGRDPNMTISAKEYPGWQGNVGNAEAARIFGVDLNDNVALGQMTIDMGDQGQRITRFVLQTSMNGKDWTTRLRTPDASAAVWDGRPHVSSFPTNTGGVPISKAVSPALPADWQEKMELTSNRASIKYLADHVMSLKGAALPIVTTGNPGWSALVRFRSLFHQPTAAIRRFELRGYPNDGQTIFLIDGKPADKGAENPLLIERELGPGLHEIQIWRNAGYDSLVKATPALWCDEPGKEALVPCRDAMFDPAKFPADTVLPQPATLSSSGDGKLVVAFGDKTRARLVRLVIHGFEGVAPSIRKVTLTNRDQKTLLPVEQDYLSLRENSQLEVLPGDQIVARYEDARSATPKRNRHEERLTVAFNDAKVTASFLNYKNTEAGRELLLEPIRRFRYDDAIAIVIDDADMDSSPEKDIVEIKVVSSSGGTATIKAVETENHSGRFLGRIFPVAGEPSRDSEVRVGEGGHLTASYRDAENLNPGIPTERTMLIEQASYREPALAAYHMTSETLQKPADAMKSVKANSSRANGEVVTPRRAISYIHADQAGKSHAAVVGASLRFDVVVPHLALAGSSAINAYVQTSAGRKAMKEGAKQPFDVNVPGTLKLNGALRQQQVVVPSGYQIGKGPVPPTNQPPLEEGRFSFSIPLILGDLPERSFATNAAESLANSAIPDGLAVRVGDIVHVGYAYQDAKNQVQWKTVEFTVESHPFLDVMDGNYHDALTQAFVGEKVYVRLIDRGLDRGPERDVTTVSLKAESGAKTDYQLQETDAHSGVFKGSFALSYAEDKLPAKLPPVALNGFPVRYGDHLEVSYTANGETQSHTVTVNTGANGVIEPFSKRFTGDEMAVTTSFTLAECFFELAKKHREMNQESLARREMAQARKLLAEAIANHRDDELRAHAEYLLGNLSQEYADLAKNDESKLPMYQDALARFSKIPADYPETEFAPKAQFKTALVYEKMGETENAVEEYVKLAYKYPDHELIPSVMSRLGGYFQEKGLSFKKQADAIRDKKDDTSKAEVLRFDSLSYPEFLNSAMVFAKLQQRFPDDPLAGLAGLRAAQNYMRAHQYEKAIKIFGVVAANEAYDDREIRSQALYWSGLSYERLYAMLAEGNSKGRGDTMNAAYQSYRRVTFDFPDSVWAKYARGRLADPVFEGIILKENQERERMIGALKEARKK